MTLERLDLSRSAVDRAAHRRTEPDLFERVLSRRDTGVLLLDGDLAPARPRAATPHLVLVEPAASAGFDAAARARSEPVLGLYLGEDAAGRSYVARARLRPPGDPAGAEADVDPLPAPPGATWSGLRELGSLLDDGDAGLLTTAVALARWHAAHPRCSRCGQPTLPVQAGWARSCPDCGAEHYPRTDPAVIMAVVDADDRILLGRQARWPQGRYSTLAGFVEPGESLEAAVRREVAEEVGIALGEMEYLGSQPWPFPSSLMLGFRARALDTEVRVDGTELVAARWWAREELALDIATGELLLPPRVSIARRLIEHWYGGRLQADEAWR